MARFVISQASWLVLAAALVGCDTSNRAPFVRTDFRDGNEEGWVAGFADLPVDAAEQFQLDSGLRDLPDEISSTGTGFYLTGFNQSDDLFMFLKRQVGSQQGLKANTTYRVIFGIRYASNAPTGCLGVGGAPGEAVTLKAGATLTEPNAVADGDMLVMNVDKGNQESGGPAASVVGNIANGTPCEDVPDLADAPFVLLEEEHTHATQITTDDNAAVWLLVGTDSGFEGVTELYYQQINVVFDEVTEAQ